MATTGRYTKTMHGALVKAIREHHTYIAAARACGVDRRTVELWRNRHPGLREDMEAAQEAGRWEDYELARSVLRKSLREMKTGDRQPDYNLLKLALARQDHDYAMQRQKTDLHVTGAVAIEQALAELDASA